MAKNIVIREEYKDAKGESKVAWNQIGILIEGKEGKQYVKLNHIPGVLCHCFEIEQKPKDGNNGEQKSEGGNW